MNTTGDDVHSLTNIHADTDAAADTDYYYNDDYVENNDKKETDDIDVGWNCIQTVRTVSDRSSPAG